MACRMNVACVKYTSGAILRKNIAKYISHFHFAPPTFSTAHLRPITFIRTDANEPRTPFGYFLVYEIHIRIRISTITKYGSGSGSLVSRAP